MRECPMLLICFRRSSKRVDLTPPFLGEDLSERLAHGSSHGCFHSFSHGFRSAKRSSGKLGEYSNANTGLRSPCSNIHPKNVWMKIRTDFHSLKHCRRAGHFSREKV